MSIAKGGRVEVSATLDPSTQQEILVQANAASNADGAYPLSEELVTELRDGPHLPATHLVARDPSTERVVGYSRLAPPSPTGAAVMELFVSPGRRNSGLGSTLLSESTRMASAAHGSSIHVWARGNHPSANALANSFGFTRQRTLLRLRRSLSSPIEAPSTPEGVTIRSFRPGTDDRAWLALNASAFVELPDQGGWTQSDLQARMAEPWFDPSGFLVAERVADGALLGFHWTKIHGLRDHAEHLREPIGEVYVLGVGPGVAGGGMGTALANAGLRYLRDRGLTRVMLYVDQANPRAVALYTRLGFTPWSIDTHLVCPLSGPGLSTSRLTTT